MLSHETSQHTNSPSICMPKQKSSTKSEQTERERASAHRRWRQKTHTEHWSETNCLANIRFYNIQFSHFIAKIFISINSRESKHTESHSKEPEERKPTYMCCGEWNSKRNALLMWNDRRDRINEMNDFVLSLIQHFFSLSLSLVSFVSFRSSYVGWILPLYC